MARPSRLTPPEAFPDLDAALAARGIALKAKPPRSTVAPSADPIEEALEPTVGPAEHSQPHPAAYAGAVLGLLLIGLLVFSVVKVSGDSIRPPTPLPSTGSASAIVAAPPPPPAPSPPPVVAEPQLAAATPAPPPPPAVPPIPASLVAAMDLTAQTMVPPPPPPPPVPAPEIAPEETLLSRLQEQFPQLFGTP